MGTLRAVTVLIQSMSMSCKIVVAITLGMMHFKDKGALPCIIKGISSECTGDELFTAYLGLFALAMTVFIYILLLMSQHYICIVR